MIGASKSNPRRDRKAYANHGDFEGRRCKPPLVVESDSTEVVGAINRVVEDQSELGPIVDEIEKLKGILLVTSFTPNAQDRATS